MMVRIFAVGCIRPTNARTADATKPMRRHRQGCAAE